MVTYRNAAGELTECALDRVADEALLSSIPVREFRWFKGRAFYSRWYGLRQRPA